MWDSLTEFLHQESESNISSAKRLKLVDKDPEPASSVVNPPAASGDGNVPALKSSGVAAPAKHAASAKPAASAKLAASTKAASAKTASASTKPASAESVTHSGVKRKLSEVSPVDKAKARAARVYHALVDPNTKLYCLFLQSAIPLFNSMNLLLQRDEPMIYVLHSRCVGVLTNLVVRFMVAEAIAKAKSLHTVDFDNRKMQKSREDLVIGQKAKAYLNECKEKEQMSAKDRTVFLDSVRKYYAAAASYIAIKFPLGDPLLHKASIADIEKRQGAKFSDLQYFVQRFPCLLQDEATVDQLEIEFLLYQVDTLPVTVLEAERLDVAWHLLGQVKDLDTKLPKYGILTHAMLGILVIPHSNADSERIFSCVRKNQTEFRPNLGVPLLESLMITKTDRQARSTPCFQQDFTPDLLDRAKRATYKGPNSLE